RVLFAGQDGTDLSVQEPRAGLVFRS
ncbi:MAG: hypothetical protein ACJA1L_002603, partial [Paracoccaceae bacterium]